ncbi:hypothetical protein R6242_21920 [Iodobacter sp. CM08]|uniref:hypothetical protein n=1 Tax=Iodobacter sp. CM08 TaxID=3085902 RepID=UPI002981B364|nr:hypothetical protein [Iodobacter sp. CM08]MDW5419235.1 hypothetical protein [Iodobacter sp. CM08]
MVKSDFFKKFMILTFFMLSSVVQAASVQQISFRNGTNDFSIKKINFRIIKSQVSLLSANNFEIYTVYVLPSESNGVWMHVPFDNKRPPVDYFLNSIESADSNIQSIRFYKKNEQLFVVKATKTGEKAPNINLKKTSIILHTYRFNENEDVPRFLEIDTRDAKKIYLNADEAINAEAFGE